jgi:hypothetical protein
VVRLRHPDAGRQRRGGALAAGRRPHAGGADAGTSRADPAAAAAAAAAAAEPGRADAAGVRLPRRLALRMHGPVPQQPAGRLPGVCPDLRHEMHIDR